MIDPREKPPPLLRCPKCSVLYGPHMTKCSRCEGPLEPALPDVPFATRDLPAGTYKRDVPFVLPSPNKIDL